VRFISIKEYVFRRLFGEYVVDWSMASSTGLFDIRRREWCPEALDAAGIDRTRLSTPVSPYQIFTRWAPDALARTGLPQGIPCVIGAGDGVLSSVGAGAVGRGIAAVNVGTSAACRYLISTPTIDPHERLWTYALDERRWVIGGIASSGGIVYDWFVRQCAARDPEGDPPAPEPHTALNDLAARVPPGAEGLIFLPYLSGEQCPVWDPETTGGFFGLTLRHGRGHLARAVYKGIALSLARVAGGGGPRPRHPPRGAGRPARMGRHHQPTRAAHPRDDGTGRRGGDRRHEARRMDREYLPREGRRRKSHV